MKKELLTVNPELKGTLKTKRKSYLFMMKQLLTSAFILIAAFTFMSFKQEDTIKIVEETTTSDSMNKAKDDCSTITYVNGMQNVVITNKNAFTAEIRINNMDIQSWINSLKAYSYKQITFHSMTIADQKMDENFKKDEILNRKLAANYSKKILPKAIEADQNMNDRFFRNVASAQFHNSIKSELQNSDHQIDETFLNTAKLHVQAVDYNQLLTSEKVKADAQMDFNMLLSNLKTFTTSTVMNGDMGMDNLLLKETSFNNLPVSANEADLKMDKIFLRLN